MEGSISRSKGRGEYPGITFFGKTVFYCRETMGQARTTANTKEDGACQVGGLGTLATHYKANPPPMTSDKKLGLDHPAGETSELDIKRVEKRGSTEKRHTSSDRNPDPVTRKDRHCIPKEGGHYDWL